MGYRNSAVSFEKAQRQSMGFGVGDPHHRNRVFVIVKPLGLRIIKDGPNKAFLVFFPSFFLVIFSSTLLLSWLLSPIDISSSSSLCIALTIPSRKKIMLQSSRL